MNLEYLGSFGVTIGGGFFSGALIGFALKKVLKILAVVVGLFFTGLVGTTNFAIDVTHHLTAQ